MNKTVGASVGPVAFSSSGDLLAFGGRSVRVLETESLRVVAQVDVIRQARRVELRSGDAVLAVDSFPDGDPRGLTQLLRWKPLDVLGDACRVMPIDACGGSNGCRRVLAKHRRNPASVAPSVRAGPAGVRSWR